MLNNSIKEVFSVQRTLSFVLTDLSAVLLNLKFSVKMKKRSVKKLKAKNIHF